jgi:hypothetical protein
MAGFDLPERFWSKVKQGAPDECWEWHGPFTRDGYGKFWWKNQDVRAHRLAAESAGMDISRFILHQCDNPKCVNPAHLYPGAHHDNMVDMKTRHRSSRRIGSLHHMTKLNEEIVLTIRKEYDSLPRAIGGKIAQRGLQRLAQKYNLVYGTMRAIVERKNWKHI